MTFGWPSFAGTSFSTVRVDAKDYIYGTDGAEILAPTALSASENISDWTVVGSVHAIQDLKIVPGTSGNPDTLQIQYTVFNDDVKPHFIGMRIMLDTAVGADDGPAIVGLAGTVLTTETDYRGVFVPGSWQAISSASGTPLSTLGTLDVGAGSPDGFVVAQFSKLVDTTYDVNIDPQASISSDSAVAVFWTSQQVAAGSAITFTTLYGIASNGSSGGGGGAVPLLETNASAQSLSVAYDVKGDFQTTYEPDPFSITASVQNLGATTATGTALTLSLGADLSLATGTATQGLGTLAPGETKQVTWLATVTGLAAGNRTTTYTVSATASNATSSSVTHSILIPGVGYLPSIHGYSFPNPGGFFPTYDEMASYYPASSPEMYMTLPSPLPPLTVHSITGEAFYDLIFKPTYTGGLCYGMSASDVTLYHARALPLNTMFGSILNSFPGPIPPPNPSPGDSDLRHFIFRYHSRQLGAAGATFSAAQLAIGDLQGNIATYQQIKTQVQTAPVWVALGPTLHLLPSQARRWYDLYNISHAVVAYRTKDATPGSPRVIAVYDPNAPRDDTAHLFVLDNGGVQLVSNGSSYGFGGTNGNATDWVLMPEPDAAFSAGGAVPTLDNYHWVLDAPRSVPIQFLLNGVGAGAVTGPILLVHDVSPSQQFFGQLPAGTGVDTTITSTAPGMRVGEFSAGRLASMEQDPLDGAGGSIAVQISADASALHLATPTAETHVATTVGADFVPDKGRQTRLGGVAIAPADAFDMSSDAPATSFTFSSTSPTPQTVTATLEQVGNNAGSATVTPVIPGGGVAAIVTSYNWDGLDQSLVWERYTVDGFTTALVLQDNLVQRRDLVGDEMAALRILVAAVGPAGIRNSLQTKLDHAERELERGDAAGGLAVSPQAYVTAANVIEALRNEVSAQMAKAISLEAGAQMHLACDIIRPMLGIVPDPDFQISIEPATQSLAPGADATFAVRTKGRATAISLRLGALPPGVIGTLERQAVRAGETTQLTVTALPDVPAWASGQFVIGASSAGSLQATSARLEISPAAGGTNPAAVQSGAETPLAAGCTSSGSTWDALIAVAAIALASRRRKRL